MDLLRPFELFEVKLNLPCMFSWLSLYTALLCSLVVYIPPSSQISRPNRSKFAHNLRRMDNKSVKLMKQLKHNKLTSILRPDV